MEKYSLKEQEYIATTLQIAQNGGWTADKDPLKFYIIIGEKLNEEEKEITELHNEIKNIECDLNQEKEINEDLEEEIKRKDDEISAKEYSIEDLENVVKEVVRELNIQRENNISLAQQVGEALKLEKKVEIQTKVIHELNEKIKEKKHEESHKEIEKLTDEIKVLQTDIEKKESFLSNLINENESIKRELKLLEEENQNTKITCNKCRKEYGCQKDLNSHMETDHIEAIQSLTMKLEELQKELSSQKLGLTMNLFNLKEKEEGEKQTCTCKGYCRIYHPKYNWKKSKSLEMFTRLESLNIQPVDQTICIDIGNDDNTGASKKSYSCEHCENSFVKVGDLSNHVKKNHKSPL